MISRPGYKRLWRLRRGWAVPGMGNQVCKRGFPRATRPDDRDHSRVDGQSARKQPGKSGRGDRPYAIWSFCLRSNRADTHPAGRLEAGLPQCFERRITLDPTEPVIVWFRDFLQSVRVRPMKTRLRAAVMLGELLRRERALASPE